MEEYKNSSPLLVKYLRAFEQNRSSRVFAPLAETYRKLGMVEEAMKVLKEGIRKNPSYTLGYLVLAHCYYDRGQFELCYNTLRPLVTSNLDNTSLQKLFAQSAEKLLLLEEALETYKYLLFLNPRDKVAQEKVKTLEAEILEEKSSYLISPVRTQELPAPEISEDEDQWVQLNLSQPKIASTKPENAYESWQMNKPGNLKIEFNDDEEYFEEESSPSPAIVESKSVDTPLMTLTLVDIYANQKLYKKALEILEKIKELNPDDDRINRKIDEIQKAKNRYEEDLKAPKDEGHGALMSFYDQKMKNKETHLKKVSKKYNAFLAKLKESARKPSSY